MAQLLVRNLDESIVRKLRLRAAAHGVSAEEEHRRILREALARYEERRPSLIEFLVSPDGGFALYSRPPAAKERAGREGNFSEGT